VTVLCCVEGPEVYSALTLALFHLYFFHVVVLYNNYEDLLK
jgi:hypothetical protein